MELTALQKEIAKIKERNSSVSADKAWEISITRKLVIFAVTYAIVWAYLAVLDVNNPHLHAAVPAGAYVLSTLSMPYIKDIWLKLIYYDFGKEKHHGIGN